jgi:hypothetical protein
MLGDGSDHQAFVIYALAIVLIRREQARLDEVAPGIAASRIVNPAFQPTVAIYALIQAIAGEAAEPIAALDALAPDAAEALGEGVLRPAMLGWLGEAAARVGSPEHQRELLAALEPYRGLVLVTGNVMCLGAADRVIGMLLLALGRVGEAIAALEAAVAIDTGLRAPLQLAWSTAWLAEALDRSAAGPDRERAARLRAEAVALGDAHGAVAVRRFAGG